MTTAPETPTAPLPPAAVDAMRRLEESLTSPEVLQAAARYKVASALTAEVGRVMSTRDLTDIEMADLLYVQDVMREAQGVLSAAGRLDLIGVAS
ncbi:hypothetical protein TU94_28290 [Streptomyces cyaneogriseus subsp. noncyanogenus]|uniref:Uncharacterized protein n=1 Tax=Streptomyces cyaneogriseus subsp. noncyanogenus TaxID=477245 RepID=A0A0C5G7N0_9ACTN|nr:hypothetical protein [Streptomyces cyaneogriseus]AJP04765.1 hypothetical protein TU94_28290 [Streptomyces cyaneogriseus subsp. noncyanogenus]